MIFSEREMNDLSSQAKKRKDMKKWMVRAVCITLATLMVGLLVVTSIFPHL